MNLEIWVAALLLGVTAAVIAYAVWRGRRESTVFQEMDRMADRLEELTLRVVGLELNQSGYRVWTAQLRGQVLELGGIPVAPPSWLAVTQESARGDEPTAVNLLVHIYHRLNVHFSAEEIDDLAFQVGIDRGELGGDSRSARTRQLVEVAYRNYQLPELVRVARRERPAVDWPPVAAVTTYQSALGKE